jgi:hypothetical protein
MIHTLRAHGCTYMYRFIARMARADGHFLWQSWAKRSPRFLPTFE